MFSSSYCLTDAHSTYKWMYLTNFLGTIDELVWVPPFVSSSMQIYTELNSFFVTTKRKLSVPSKSLNLVVIIAMKLTWFSRYYIVPCSRDKTHRIDSDADFTTTSYPSLKYPMKFIKLYGAGQKKLVWPTNSPFNFHWIQLNVLSVPQKIALMVPLYSKKSLVCTFSYEASIFSYTIDWLIKSNILRKPYDTTI